jgi:hypothetical protein
MLAAVFAAEAGDGVVQHKGDICSLARLQAVYGGSACTGQSLQHAAAPSVM